MTRKRHLTARIKPATRDAMLDQLAAIADGIIRDRELIDDAYCKVVYAKERLDAVRAELSARPWWRRLLGLR